MIQTVNKMKRILQLLFKSITGFPRMLIKKQMVTLFFSGLMITLNAGVSLSQEKLSLHLDDATVLDVIDEIESESDFRFVYRIQDVNLEQTVNIDIDNADISEILDRVFSGTDTHFRIMDNQVFLIQKESTNPDRTIQGHVESIDGEALPGATILVKGTSNGTITDVDGNYSLTISDDAQTLVVSYVGYETLEFELTNASVYDIVLDPISSVLDEVVVVAYGTQKKEAITGSVAVIKAEEIAEVSQGNVLQSLAGKVPGLRVNFASGQPGDAPNISIRGLNSLNSLSSPLYVIDGIPIELDSYDQAVGTGFNVSQNSREGSFKSNQLAFLNQNDIETISILKDGEATALYGSRASNGVVVITTKKGKVGKPRVSADISTIYSKPANPREYITDPAEYYETYYQYIVNDLKRKGDDDPAGNAAKYIISNVDGNGRDYDDYWLNYNAFNVPDDQLINPSTGKLNPNAQLLWQDDWKEATLKSNVSKRAFLSLSGGNSDGGTYYFSLGYDDIGSYLKNTDFQRTSLNLTLSQPIGTRFNIRGKLSYSQSDKNVANISGLSLGNPLLFARNIAPIYPIYLRDENGDLITDKVGNKAYDYGVGDQHWIPSPDRERPSTAFRGHNPLGTLENDINHQKFQDFIGNFRASYQLTDDLSLIYAYQIGTNVERREVFRHRKPLNHTNYDSEASLENRSNEAFFSSHQQFLNWKKSIGPHNLEIMVGHESNSKTFMELKLKRQELLIPDVNSLNSTLSGWTGFDPFRGYKWDYRIEGYLSRVLYNYNRKYFLSGSFRRDGSSSFHPDVRWGNFYGFGAAWKASAEPFFQQIDGLDDLRIKVSYGQQGNDRVTYPHDPGINDRLINGGRRNYLAYENQWRIAKTSDGKITASLAYLGNEDLTWEVSNSFNTGMEVSLFRDRVYLTAEFFVKKISDMFYNDNQLNSKGLPSITKNIGDMENRGYELSLDVNLINKKDFSWNIYLNGTHVDNKVTKIASGDGEESTNLERGGYFKLEEGKSAFEFYLKEYAGVDKENGDALFYKNSGTEPGETTNNSSRAQKVFIGKNALPDLYGGFSTYLDYKGLYMDVTFSYQLGGYGIDEGYYSALYVRRGRGILTDIADKTWSVDNPDAELPRLGEYINPSDAYITKASYLALENIRLGYALPSTLLSKNGIQSAKVYANITNLFMKSARDGYDPRINPEGINVGSSYTAPKNYTLGVNLSF